MIRFTVIHLLFLLLPFVVYAIYWWFVLRPQAGQSEIKDTPWTGLIAAGLVLMAGSLAYTASTAGSPASCEYTPPRYEDGRVVPAQTC